MAYPLNKLTREQILEEAKKIVLSGLMGVPAAVYLFGSWAKGSENRSSDIDIGIWSETPLPMGTLSKIRSLLEESFIPYRIDLVDLTHADSVMIAKVKREGIIWKDYESE